MKKSGWIEWIFIVFISAIVAVFINIQFIIGTAGTPADAFYLGVTHHIWDYFFYLSQVTQGAQGHILTNDLFTSEYTAPGILYWPNILLGHIARVTHLSQIMVFNVSVYILVFSLFILVFYLFKTIFPKKQLAVTGFLFFVFSTSVLNRLPEGSSVPYWPFELWGTPHLITTRFNTLPHHIVQIILFCLIIYALFHETAKVRPWIQHVLLGIAVSLLTLLQPVFTALMIGCYGLSVIVLKKKEHTMKLVTMVIGFLIPFTYTMTSFGKEPFIQLRNWEYTNQTPTTTWFLLLSIGPIVPFAISGILLRIKRLTHIEWFGLILLTVSYILFRFPDIVFTIRISNVRVLSPGNMIFLAWFAAAGVDGIAELLTKKKKHLKALVATCLLFIFFVAVTPTILWEIRQKIDPKNMPSPIIYIPSSAYDAFRFIAKDPLWQHVTLGNPVSYTDTIAPALTGHKSYSGHPLTTIRSEEKKAQATAFFKLDMTEDQAYTFLKSIPITYVIYMVYDGDINVFRGTYRFLTPVFSSPGATVFTIK